MKPAGLLLVLLSAGCAQTTLRTQPGELFPTGAFDEKLLLGACPLQVQTFRTLRDQTSPATAPVIGGHARHTLIDVRERSPEVEVIALQIDAYPTAPDEAIRSPNELVDSDFMDEGDWGGSSRYPSYTDRLFSGVATEDQFHDMSVWLNGSPEISVRVLLRRRVQGGLFDSLSHCFESYATRLAPPGTSYARIVIDTPEAGSTAWVSLELY